MKKAKILSVLCAAAIAMAAFAGCTPATEGTTSGGTTSGGTTSSKDIPTLVWYQIGAAPENLSQAVAAMNEYTAEKIGAKIDLKYLDWGVWADKIKTIVSTGEAFDMMFTNGDWYNTHVMMGAFADLTDILPTEAPELNKFIPEDLWGAVTVKEKIYAVPTYKDSSQRQYWVWDKEMVDKYEIDYANLKTLQDLDPALRKIKEGEGKTFYPFIINGDGVNGQFIYYDTVRYDDATATVVDPIATQEMMDYYKQLHVWYKDGIINPDAPTMTELPKVRTCFSAQGFPGADVTWTTNMGKDVVSNPWSPAIYTTGTITGSVNAISSNSKNVNAALKYLELANTDPKLRNMLAYGIEGENFKMLENNTIEKLNEVWTAPAYSQATFFTMAPVAPNPPDQWTMVQKQNEEAEGSVLLGFSFDRTAVDTEMTNIAAVGEKYNKELYTGAQDPTVVLPKYLDEKKAAGYEKVVAEQQRQINEFLGK